MAKDKRPIKEFEAVPNPWNPQTKPKTVEYDPKTGSKGKATVKREEKEKLAEPEKPTFTDEQFIEALRKIGKPASSREISDALGIEDAEYGRALVRRVMERLTKEAKVVAEEPKEKIRAAKHYKVSSLG